MKVDVTLGVMSLGMSLLGQTMPEIVPGLVSQFGALGLVFWMMIHTTMVTIPGINKRNDDYIAKLMEMHREERTEMATAFTRAMEQQRADFERMLAKFEPKKADHA